jgi:hypothetical protein
VLNLKVAPGQQTVSTFEVVNDVDLCRALRISSHIRRKMQAAGNWPAPLPWAGRRRYRESEVRAWLAQQGCTE